MRVYLYIITFLILSIATFCGGFFYILNHSWVNFAVLENYNPGKPSIVLDDAGNELMRFQLDRREPVRLAIMPQHLINAFLAAEDQHFYSHVGISFKGIIRSIAVNILQGKIAQGASTITQQLVKLLFFNNRRTFERKIKEQIISIIVERQFTKEQILEIYLNHIYLGCGIYGVEAASQRFWGKHVQDLTLDEAATLAAIVRSPENNCPLNSSENAYKRRNIVLKMMLKSQFITQEVYDTAIGAPLVIELQRGSVSAPHVREMIRMQCEELLDKKLLYNGGYTIQTTINSLAQKTAAASLHAQITHLHAQLPGLDGALVTLDQTNGAIKALIGGYDFNVSQFNRVLQARRQLGSTFKPIIYATALELGAQFTDTAIDEPLTITDHQQVWTPQNYTQKFIGPMTLAAALYRSNNIIAIKLLIQNSIPKVIERAQAYGLTGALPPYPSLALGCAESSVLELASMFTVFAHNGTRHTPYLIEWIKDEFGVKIWKYKSHNTRVTSNAVSSQVKKVLTIGMEKLRCVAPEQFPKSDVMGKTGTTNDARTCWFVGATPHYTTATYIGFDDNRPMGKHVFASQTALPIWLEVHKLLESGYTDQKHFTYDSSLIEITINEFTGKTCSIHDENAITLLVSN